MKSISFANPFLLLLILPIVAFIVVSFIIAIRKDSKTKDTVASLVLHIVMTVLAITAAAGMTYTSIITKTEVVVVVDGSYSASEKTELIDQRIRELQRSFIGNTDLAVVVFGKDQTVSTAFGERFLTVGDAVVNDSETDIAAALSYAEKLYSDNSIKRLVLITDGVSTGVSGDSDVARVVNNLFSADITVDAIFLDTNLKEGEGEVEVNSVDYTKSTYRGHETTASALITTNVDTRAIVKLLRNGADYSVKTVSLKRGFNLVNFSVVADSDGIFDYTVSVEVEDDKTAENNSFSFTQKVTGDLRVLLVTNTSKDKNRLQEIYGASATIDTYNTASLRPTFMLPYSVEELIKYDEIVISSVDILELPNYSEFINSVDTVVSEFGKSLVTFGNNNIQNKTEESFKKLENMLPVNYGNNERETALITLIVDCSKSMNTAGRLNTTRDMLKELVKQFAPEDKVGIVAFFGDNYTALSPTEVGDMSAIYEAIDTKLDPKQGTVIGNAIEKAYTEMKDLNYSKRQAILVSDGLSYVKLSEDDTAKTAAASMYANCIVLSTINMWSASDEAVSLMETLAELGGGTAYYIENERDYVGKIQTEFADRFSESIIEKQLDVLVELKNDEVLAGVGPLNSINGITFAAAKSNAHTVLRVDWKKNEFATVNIPLYAYWDYGNGRVSVLNTSLTGEWVSGWNNDDGLQFFSNILSTAVPEEKIDYPSSVNISEDGTYRDIELVPANLNADASVKLTVTSPSGVVTVYDMIFDSTKYVLTVVTDEVGRYDLHIDYVYPAHQYSADIAINVSYSKEYNRFIKASDRVLLNAIRQRGDVVSEDKIPTYEYDESRLTTYVISFTTPFLIAACLLFVIDVIIRKLKWSDIVALFKKIKKG